MCELKKKDKKRLLKSWEYLYVRITISGVAISLVQRLVISGGTIFHSRYLFNLFGGWKKKKFAFIFCPSALCPDEFFSFLFSSLCSSVMDSKKEKK